VSDHDAGAERPVFASSNDLLDALSEGLFLWADQEGVDDLRVHTFEEAGVLCGNLGLVVRDPVTDEQFQVELPGSYGEKGGSDG